MSKMSMSKMRIMKRAFAFVFCLPLLATGPRVPINEAGFQKLVDSHKGKVVLYDFWATWCAPCRAEFPQLVLLEDKLRSQGLEVITISADDQEHKAAADKFIQMFRVQARLTANRPTTTIISSMPSIPSGAALYPRCSSMTGPDKGAIVHRRNRYGRAGKSRS